MNTPLRPRPSRNRARPAPLPLPPSLKRIEHTLVELEDVGSLVGEVGEVGRGAGVARKFGGRCGVLVLGGELGSALRPVADALREEGAT